ncbi:MAG TPA: GMC family oxidoreductase [Steroidobacteraceae bacterium]|jgi:choline dehydrogenase-like flavoprotein
MLIDGRSVPAGFELTCDLCIVGAGPAGITIATELRNQNLKIVLLESGGLQPELETQALAKGEVAGLGYVPLETARVRCFGGSTGHWHGWCGPLDDIDFETRPWVPHSGWPIRRADLVPYYPRAQQLCELGPFDYDPAHWNLGAAPLLPLKGAAVRSTILQLSPPTRFGIRYRTPVLAAENIGLYIYSNVTRLDPSANGALIDRLQVATLAGNRFTVKAKHYVLATGGIENPRLLLSSNDVIKTGIGNAYDNVGRYFADHIQVDTAGIFPLRSDVSFNLYTKEDRATKYPFNLAGGGAATLLGKLCLSEQTQRAEKTLNYSARISPTYLSDYYLHSRSQEITSASSVTKMADKLRTIASSVDEAASIASDRALGRERTFYKLVTLQEQAPNPSSRVTLGTQRDAMGMLEPRLEWRLTDLDRHTIKVAAAHIVEAFSASGVARLQIPIDLDATEWPSNMGCSWHHCGTTRMHADPKRGVVDANCKVHGMHNFFIAGSSVFATNGQGNPTLNIVTLSLRLADHLRKVFAA